MSILIIIFVIICLVAGMMSRSKSTVIRDNDNAHLFNNDEGFVLNKSVNKKDLKEEIENLYERKKYREVKNKILNI